MTVLNISFLELRFEKTKGFKRFNFTKINQKKKKKKISSSTVLVSRAKYQPSIFVLKLQLKNVDH